MDSPLPRGMGEAPTTIIFGGHCQRTYYLARVVGSKLEFVEAPQLGRQTPEEVTGDYELGDGRVPVWSVGWGRPVNALVPGYNFFLCADHLGMVKDPAFRYNLLRELLVVRPIPPFPAP